MLKIRLHDYPIFVLMSIFFMVMSCTKEKKEDPTIVGAWEIYKIDEKRFNEEGDVEKEETQVYGEGELLIDFKEDGTCSQSGTKSTPLTLQYEWRDKTEIHLGVDEQGESFMIFKIMELKENNMTLVFKDENMESTMYLKRLH